MSAATPLLVRSLRRRFAITRSVIGFALTGTWLYLMFSVKTQVEILVCITGWYMSIAFLTAVVKVVQAFKEGRLKQRMSSMDGAVCCKCGYRLVGLTGHHRCPECEIVRVKRVSTGIFQCRHCGFKYASGAYGPSPLKNPRRRGVEQTEKDNVFEE